MTRTFPSTRSSGLSLLSGHGALALAIWVASSACKPPSRDAIFDSGYSSAGGSGDAGANAAAGSSGQAMVGASGSGAGGSSFGGGSFGGTASAGTAAVTGSGGSDSGGGGGDAQHGGGAIQACACGAPCQCDSGYSLNGMVCVPSTPAPAATLYVSPSGSDANVGRSPAAPLKSIGAAIAKSAPGDVIWLEAGATFNEAVVVPANKGGTPASPLSITSDSTMPARIVVKGGNDGIRIDDASFVTLENLVVVGPGATSSAQQNGVELAATGSRQQVALRNLDISGFYRGIYLNGRNWGAGFDGVLIEGSKVHDNVDAGIASWSDGSGHRHVTVRRCEAWGQHGDPNKNKPSGSGIELAGVADALVEHCAAHDNGGTGPSSEGPVGIWTYNSTRVTLQFNESYRNHAKLQDGDGFDLDVNVTDSVMQYNYSHDNDGAGLLFCQLEGNGDWGRNVARYNVSENDGRKRKMGGLSWCQWPGLAERDSWAYGNTVYNAYAPAVMPTWEAASSNNVAFDNVFVTANGQPLVWSWEGGHAPGAMRFQGNLYWASGAAVDLEGYGSLDAWRSGTGQEKLGGKQVGTFADPLLAPYTSSCNDKGMALVERVKYRILSKASPVLNAGLPPAEFNVDAGGHDFFGNSLPQGSAYDIGAQELLPPFQ